MRTCWPTDYPKNENYISRNKFWTVYRDDGVGTIRRMPKGELDPKKNKIKEMFKERGLNIEIKMNLTHVNYLDVSLDLHRDMYYPYRKPNDEPVYVHKESNHPKHVLKQIPTAINTRINAI